MKVIVERHKSLWRNRPFVVSVISGLALFLVSFGANYAAGVYATKKSGSGVPDLFLDILPTLDMSFVVVDIAALLGFLLSAKGVSWCSKSIYGPKWC